MTHKILLCFVVLLLALVITSARAPRPTSPIDKVVDINKARTGTNIFTEKERTESKATILSQLMSNLPSLNALEKKLDNIDSEVLFKLSLYVIAWYFFTVTHNIAHKVVVHDIPLPLTVAAFELAVGIPVFLPAWQLKMPKINLKVWNTKYGSIATAHALSTIFNAVSLRLDRRHMTWHYVAQALEPLIAYGLTLSSLDKSWRDAPVGMTVSLIIIVLGMLTTCPLKFTHGAVGAFISSFAGVALGQARTVLGHLTISDSSKRSNSQSTQKVATAAVQTQVVHESDPEPEEVNLSVSNVVRATTLLAALFTVPLAMAVEGYRWGSVWRDLSLQINGPNVDPQLLLANLVISGAAYFCVQEMSFHILALASPVSLAVGASTRRVLAVCAALFLKIPFEIRPEVVIGTTITLLGLCCYVITSNSPSTTKAF